MSHSPKLVKVAYARGELDERRLTKNDIVRTDFILENIFFNTIKCHNFYPLLRAINVKELDALNCMTVSVEKFSDFCGPAFESLCEEMKYLSPHRARQYLTFVASEIFANGNGITESRIITFIVFVKQLTIKFIRENVSSDIVDVIYECFYRLVHDELEGFIDYHDGWENVAKTSLEETSKQQRSFREEKRVETPRSLLNSLLEFLQGFANIFKRSPPPVVVKVQDDENDEDECCSICKESYCSQEEISPNNYKLHKHCIQRWFENENWGLISILRDRIRRNL